jgi:hypothetical protein
VEALSLPLLTYPRKSYFKGEDKEFIAATMPTAVTTGSTLAGDPRLAKLKEVSLTRRRAPPSEYSIPAFREEVNDRSSAHQKDENDTNDATTVPPLSHLMAPTEALRILNLDPAAEGTVDNNNYETSRLNMIQAVRALASIGTATAANAPPTALDHLRRRLRSTTAQLAFHEANASIHSNSAETSRKSGDGQAPWLPSSTTFGSKHKAVQLQAQAAEKMKKNNALGQQKESIKPPRPSPQASALQTKLLSELKERLQLKAVLLALQQAVQQRNLVEDLVERMVTVEKHAQLQHYFENWKQATLPNKEKIRAAEFHGYKRQICVAKEALQVWRAWSAAQQQRKEAAAVGAAAHRRRLLDASLAYWKFATTMEHLSMLRSALVEGWLNNWGRRKALLAWRRTARRHQQQRGALLAASSCALGLDINESEDHVVISSSKSATLAEAAANQRALARSHLAGLKICIAEVSTELNLMRPALRWTDFYDDSSTNNHASILTRPLYDPSAYASPIKKRRQHSDRGNTMNPAIAAAEEIAAELFICNEELEVVENECHVLREKLRKLEQEEAAVVNTDAAKYHLAAQQAEQDVSVAILAVDDAENVYQEAQAVVEIVNEEIELQKTLLSKCLHEARSYQAAADAAAAALTSARDEFETSSTAVEAWTKRVALAAAELTRAPPNAKSAVALKLKEARHRLEMEKLAVTEAHQEIPNLLERSQETAEKAEESELALIAAQQSALAASSAESAACSDLKSAHAAVTAAKIALTEAQETENNANSAYDATIEKAAALHEDARQVRLHLFTREREVALMQARVTELDERHAEFVALSMEYEEQANDVLLLEFPAQTASKGLLDYGLPTVPLPVDGTSGGDDDRSTIITATQADHNELAEEYTNESTTSWNSVATTPFSSPTKDPLSLTAASRSFYRSRLLRRAMHALQNEAAQWKELNAISAYEYCISILPAAFEAWKETTADAVAIDGANVEIARMLSSLKAWRTYSAKCQLLRQLEAEYIEMKER